ncbi:MAG: hypothetical protein KF782_12715 [Labilithrix sp.]|nr:hypothetical protein [Labilithrix sp.]
MRFLLGAITGLCLFGASCFVSAPPHLGPTPVRSELAPRVSSTGIAATRGEAAGVEREPTAAEGDVAMASAEPPLLDTWSLAAR